jgi:hypothetical protein
LPAPPFAAPPFELPPFAAPPVDAGRPPVDDPPDLPPAAASAPGPPPVIAPDVLSKLLEQAVAAHAAKQNPTSKPETCR